MDLSRIMDTIRDAAGHVHHAAVAWGLRWNNRANVSLKHIAVVSLIERCTWCFLFSTFCVCQFYASDAS